MSPELRAYLAAWLAWAEGDAPDNRPFSRGMGLCGNSIGEREHVVYGSLTQALEEDFGVTCYPFNYDVDYSYEAARRIMHLNLARLAWVRKQLEMSS